MKISAFRQWVKRKLGESSCGVTVELSDDQIDLCLDDAKEWFSMYHGLYREDYISLVSGQTEYDMSSVTPRIDDIVGMFFQRSSVELDFSKLYPGFYDVNGIPYGSQFSLGGMQPMSDLVQNMQTISSMKRLFNSDLHYEFYRDFTDTDNPVVLLRVIPAPGSGVALYAYRVDPSDVPLEAYSPKHLFLIKEYALAECKYTLGRIRGKYKSLPVPGGERSLDGDDLIQESERDKERLDEKIKQIQGPVGLVVG